MTFQITTGSYKKWSAADVFSLYLRTEPNLKGANGANPTTVCSFVPSISVFQPEFCKDIFGFWQITEGKVYWQMSHEMLNALVLNFLKKFHSLPILEIFHKSEEKYKKNSPNIFLIRSPFDFWPGCCRLLG